jgi:DNA processing protein
MDANGRAWLCWALALGVGPRTALRVVEQVGSVEASVRLSARALESVLGARRGRDAHEALRAVDVDAALREAARHAQRVLTPADDAWPREAFAALHDPPLALFVRGRWPAAWSLAVAMVGTRRATAYGRRLAGEIAADLAAHGHAIVSGMALGIDGAAHEGALAGAPADVPATVAVLGSGLDVPYPPENAALLEAIVERGAAVSEHPPGTEPQKGHFPRRNRLVAALGAALVVVEAPAKSGALLTARIAVELGREVLAVPGPAREPTSAGCHALLRKQEAALCESADDVRAALGLDALGETRAAAEPPAGPALALWTLIEPGELVDADALCRRSGLGPDEVAEGLAVLESEGRLARVPGAGYVRR